MTGKEVTQLIGMSRSRMPPGDHARPAGWAVRPLRSCPVGVNDRWRERRNENGSS
jgi:hypothetical protein